MVDILSFRKRLLAMRTARGDRLEKLTTSSLSNSDAKQAFLTYIAKYCFNTPGSLNQQTVFELNLLSIRRASRASQAAFTAAIVLAPLKTLVPEKRDRPKL